MGAGEGINRGEKALTAEATRSRSKPKVLIVVDNMLV